MTLRPLRPFALAAAAAPLLAAPAAAGAGVPLVAGYWTEFYDHWSGLLRQQNGVVVFTMGVGAVCLFIITRGKWRK